MRVITESLYSLLTKLPPFLRERWPVLPVRNKLRHWEILRRTKALVADPQYSEGIREEKYKVVFVSPIYKSFPLLAVSLFEQTYRNWELLFVHDGPADELDDNSKAIIESDNRIRMIQSKTRANDWGHTPRQIAFEELRKNGGGDFLVVTNSDNYHVPGYIEKMLEHFDDGTHAVYCDMIHEYYSWRNFKTRLEYSFIDCGCVMSRSDSALKAGWNDNTYEGDWKFVADLIDVCGTRAIRKVGATLFIHS
jgi:hypothetical protein